MVQFGDQVNDLTKWEGTWGMMLKRSAEEDVGESWQLGTLDRGQTNSDVRG